MEYVPYETLGTRPNIIVDGPANAHTALALSHWPMAATPDALRDDLSTQIVFKYLDRPEFHVAADAVSNNHFDEDGLVGIYALLNPREAQLRRELMIDVAAAGDFGTYRLRDAARVTFVLSAFADADRSPLDAAIFRQSYPAMASSLYREMLPRAGEILDDVQRFRSYWESDDATLAESERLIEQGRVQIEEFPALDLAVVTLPAGHTSIHQMALHNVLRSFRVLSVAGNRYELQYRYESWVRYVSQTPAPRIDLSPLADMLSGMETGGTTRWSFDGVDEIAPKLKLEAPGDSTIPPQQFVASVKDFLSRPA